MPSSDLTEVLRRAQVGDDEARDALVRSLYDELHSIARRQFVVEREDHTLQTTALVNEAWIRLVDQTRVQWRGRAHFLAIAAQAMRRILVDHARGVRSLKRGAGAHHLSLTAAADVAVSGEREVDVLELEEALERLASDHPDHARLVEMRFFGGMTAREVAEAEGVSERTAERRWRFARAWLYRALGGETD